MTSKIEGRRERFQKWVLATKHPVLGFLDGHWLARGDDREGYASEYVQGLWVAFKEFAAPESPRQSAYAWEIRYSDDGVHQGTVYTEERASYYAKQAYDVIPLYRHPAPLSPDHSGGAGVVLPEGWRLVPIEPTSSMLEAGKDERMDCFTNPNLSVEGALIRIYSAIIKASPHCLDKVKELNQCSEPSRNLVLTDEQFDQFQKLLKDNPMDENRALQDLLDMKSRWSK